MNNETLKARVREQLKADTTELVYQQPFLAMLLMRLQLVVVVDDRLQTAATDGTHIFADARFMDQLAQADRVFVLAHEVWHCAMGHFVRRRFMANQARELQFWNCACDFEVNAIVQEQLRHLPDFVLYDSEWAGFSAEQIYSRLLKNSETIQAEVTTTSSGEAGNFDVHNPAANDPADDCAEIDPEFAPVAASNPREIADQTEMAKRWRHYVAQSAQIARQRGAHIPEVAQLAIGRLLRPQLPWTMILRRYVEQTFGNSPTWQPPNRRYVHQGLYLPGKRAVQLDITVAVDTSGSTMEYLKRFFSELAGILKSFPRIRVQVLECDSAVRQAVEFDEHNLHQLKDWQPQGGGGTSFVPVFEHIATQQKGQPRLLVFFTDGEGYAPVHAPGYPVLWVLTPMATGPYAVSGDTNPRTPTTRIPWGQKVFMQKDAA
ncbi:vWA domain-containing protein [Aliidiomarina sp. Khilg15.8]